MMRLNRLVFTALWGLAIAAIVFATFGVNVRIGASRPTPTSQSRDPSTQPSPDDSIPASLENLLVTVTGLKENDVATITLLPETAPKDSVSILQRVTTGNGESETIDMSVPLQDGYYRLSISAPDEYFREPRAWDFMVADSQLINPQDKSAVFRLIPPELQTYKPFRESAVDTSTEPTPEPPSTPPSTKVELIRSLSDPPKQPIENGVDSTGYHHFHWESSLDSPGIWARFAVSNPGVRNGSTVEFALDHIYVLKAGYYTLEIGWVEASWKAPDTRYGFVYDPVYTWGYFDLPGSPLEVQLYSCGTNTWYAMYYSGDRWLTAESQNLGYSEYDYALNGGEVYTDYGDHPSIM